MHESVDEMCRLAGKGEVESEPRGDDGPVSSNSRQEEPPSEADVIAPVDAMSPSSR